MGLLKVGKPLTWQDCVEHSEYIRRHGIEQFLATWRRVKDIANDRLYYGDEIEYAVLKLDDKERRARISLRGAELMEVLRGREDMTQPHVRGCQWHQEYGSWMLEGTPATPYGGYTSSLVQVENNMRLRRARLLAALAPDEIAPTMVNFPLMGVGDFVHPPSSPGGPSSLSSTVPDACINPHPRFGTLTANIRHRRGSKVDIQVPCFQDSTDDTPSTPRSKRPRKSDSAAEGTQDAQSAAAEGKDPSIHMDCMAFGMGCCCLQVTFQASDVGESRYLYDQLATLAPILMALTAATPIFHGQLAGVDVRWGTIAASVDDRTPAERGDKLATKVQQSDPRMAGGGTRRMSKSRYDSISCYIHKDSSNEYFNDVPCEVDEDLQSLLISEGIDKPLAKHLAHLFVRDPLVAFEGAIQEVADTDSVEHFDSINSTNWQTVRWKPPPPKVGCCDPEIGWRTEFRSMEVQLTDFENAAFTAFVVLITRALLVFNLDLLVPLSKVDENMQRAHGVNAVKTGQFWFRKHIVPESICQLVPRPATTQSDAFEEMTMHEVINGKGCYFPGLVPLCYAYLEHIQCDAASFTRLDAYLGLVAKRAAGELLTPAAWMRSFVREHPDYKQDAVISQTIAYDLVRACDDIGRGKLKCPALHGDIVIEPISQEATYGTPLKALWSQDAITKLLKQICSRAAPHDGPGSTPQCPMRGRSASVGS
mmetsp:Transcript_26375/g.60033  ORF Transcript_26375/g.60033 Transcript_26375/m.60033 type:complete len:706 (+) Transcript_26375:38-2155(+)